MKTYPPEFESIVFEGDMESGCSPELPDDDDWQGIRINAPDRLEFDASEEIWIPVCTMIQYQVSTDVGGGFRANVTDLATGKTRVAEIRSTDRSAMAPEPNYPEPEPEPDVEMADVVIVSHINVNLSEHIDLPRRSAEYSVYLEFLGMRSNEVTIELVVE